MLLLVGLEQVGDLDDLEHGDVLVHLHHVLAPHAVLPLEHASHLPHDVLGAKIGSRYCQTPCTFSQMSRTSCIGER